MNRIIIDNFNGKIEFNFLKGLEEILCWFQYKAIFIKNEIQLLLEDDKDIIESRYWNLNDFIKSWIDTCEEAMAGDKNIDYSDWVAFLKANLIL